MLGGSITATIRMGLALLQLNVRRAPSAVPSSFFLYSKSDSAFVDPPSEEYIRELHACWSDTKAFSHLMTDGRALSAMQELPRVGLGQMPAVEPGITSLLIPPDEALWPNACCPWP